MNEAPSVRTVATHKMETDEVFVALLLARARLALDFEHFLDGIAKDVLDFVVAFLDRFSGLSGNL